MTAKLNAQFLQVINSISATIDLISPKTFDHHSQVAYIASQIAEELRLSQAERMVIVLAGLLHDIGALSLGERLESFELEFGLNGTARQNHSVLGYLLLKQYHPLAKIAEIIKYHHVYWNEINLPCYQGKVPLGSLILHLADRVVVLINKERDPVQQSQAVLAKIEEKSGIMFSPSLVKVLKKIAQKEYFWLDIASSLRNNVIKENLQSMSPKNKFDDFTGISRMLCHIIDFRSPFTATHSSGVAVIAEALARIIKFSEDECLMMKSAGYLHDLGKLAIPDEILNKPAGLTGKEYNIIKSHAYYTHRALEKIKGFETINTWASLHHERLNGAGYPFHLQANELPLGSRIMAVADLFTALTEERPYRQGMSNEQAFGIIREMADKSELDNTVVNILHNNLEPLSALRYHEQMAVAQNYRDLRVQSERLTAEMGVAAS